MQPIGGYFSLELPYGEEYHKNAIRLNTGRNCLEFILRSREYKKVYIPYYTCDVILEPFQKLGIAYSFYHINQSLEISELMPLQANEALLYTNYYGLKQRYVENLVSKYGSQLIVDNTQAFYAKPLTGIDTFYTCRKFFGVPDGSYLYTDKLLDVELEQDISYERMKSLTKRIDLSPEAGYQDFRDACKTLIDQPIKQMSRLTQRMMRGINYKVVAQQRRTNYLLLDAVLCHDNNIELPLDDDAVPMVYPYFIPEKDSLRKRLIAKKIYVAQYWPNVLEWCKPEEWEYQLAENLVCLPIDQRYGEEEMKQILHSISSYD